MQITGLGELPSTPAEAIGPHGPGTVRNWSTHREPAAKAITVTTAEVANRPQLPVCPLSRSLCESIHRSRHISTSRLKNRVLFYRGQTASRRSVEKKDVRDLHYADAALFF